MSRKRCALSSQELNGGKKLKPIGLLKGAPDKISRCLLFSSSPLSAATIPAVFEPSCSQTSHIQPRRSRRLRAFSTRCVQQMDCGVVLLFPSNAGSIPQSQHSSGYSRGKTPLKNFPSSSRYAMQEDDEMFRRLIEISTETWRLPPKHPCPYCKAIRFANEPPGFCCASGKIEIQVPKMPNELWNLYAIDMTPLGVEFRRRCRTYNNSMAFTSIKMSYDEALAKAHRGVYTFKVQGIVRHYIHELTPKDGVPRHLQLYFYGTERELENRVSQSEGLDSAIVSLLVNILKNNPYHNFFTNLQNRSDLDTYAIVCV